MHSKCLKSIGSININSNIFYYGHWPSWNCLNSKSIDWHGKSSSYQHNSNCSQWMRMHSFMNLFFFSLFLSWEFCHFHMRYCSEYDFVFVFFLIPISFNAFCFCFDSMWRAWLIRAGNLKCVLLWLRYVLFFFFLFTLEFVFSAFTVKEIWQKCSYLQHFERTFARIENRVQHSSVRFHCITIYRECITTPIAFYIEWKMCEFHTGTGFVWLHDYHCFHHLRLYLARLFLCVHPTPTTTPNCIKKKQRKQKSKIKI